jgi:hypothetical protein
MKELILALFTATSPMAHECTPIVGNYINAGRISCDVQTGSEWKGERGNWGVPKVAAKPPEEPDDYPPTDDEDEDYES